MMLRVRRYTLPLLGAGFLALVAVASFLILDLTDAGPGSASDLPVVDIGQTELGSAPPESTEASPSTSLGTSMGGGGSGQAASPGQQSGPGQPGGVAEQGGDSGSSPQNTTVPGTNPPDNTAPSGQTSPGTSMGNQPHTTGENLAGSGMTGSTLRQTITGAVRVEGGPGSGRGTGSGSGPRDHE